MSTLFNLPPEITTEITQPAYIGKSTHFVFRRVCKAAAELVPTISADSLCTCAAAEGHLDILKWGYENGYNCVDFLLYNAAISGGHLDVLKWLRHVFKQYRPSYGTAAENGHLHILQYGFRKYEYVRERGAEFAEHGARKGRLNIVEWLWNQGHRSDDSIRYAVDSGHLQVVRYLHEQSGRIIYDLLYTAIHRGYIEVIEYLCSVGYTPSPDAFQYAVTYYQLEVLKWFHQNGHVLTGNLHDYAIHNGRTKIADWLRTVGY